jgi:hypothetical protein
MSLILFRSGGGFLVLPDRASLLVSRENGGNLVVNPPRPVWDRSELSASELTAFACLVAAAGRAMIDELSQLAGGCVNYWEAGNWALNAEAEPQGRKDARTHRQMHLHLLGRSPASTDPAWAWGESPRFPMFAERLSWAARFERLSVAECTAIVGRTDALLRGKYASAAGEIAPWSPCERCGYPSLALQCAECASGSR